MGRGLADVLVPEDMIWQLCAFPQCLPMLPLLTVWIIHVVSIWGTFEHTFPCAILAISICYLWRWNYLIRSKGNLPLGIVRLLLLLAKNLLVFLRRICLAKTLNVNLGMLSYMLKSNFLFHFLFSSYALLPSTLLITIHYWKCEISFQGQK